VWSRGGTGKRKLYKRTLKKCGDVTVHDAFDLGGVEKTEADMESRGGQEPGEYGTAVNLFVDRRSAKERE